MIRTVLRWVNDGLAFLLELAALAALGYWGARVGPGATAKVALAVGAPGLAAVAWGLFAAPRARFALPLAAVLAVKALVFGAATGALYAAGQRGLAVWFGALVVGNTIAVTLLRRAPGVEPGDLG